MGVLDWKKYSALSLKSVPQLRLESDFFYFSDHCSLGPCAMLIISQLAGSQNKSAGAHNEIKGWLLLIAMAEESI
jgi:hypothetical protein